MKCIETFKTGEKAGEKQQLLASKGITSHILVDPLEGRYPALSDFCDVALMVPDHAEAKASTILKSYKKAG